MVARGNAGKGRPKGSKNRISTEVKDILRRAKVDPVTELLKISRERGVEVDVRLRVFCELAKYIYPQRKATEISGPAGAPLTITVVREDVP
jgi:hypothetical protein